MSLAVKLSGITKRFGVVAALDAVDLSVRQGTIHALVGENGAGKTTLMRALYGAIRLDHGTIEVDSTPRTFANSEQAIRAGIGMVSQHYAIIAELTCIQNLILGAEGGEVLHPRSAIAHAQALADQMGFTFDWTQPASDLSPAAAQKLEILKLLWRNAQIMILDEPTAMLSPADSDALFSSLQLLVARGATVILVTHRLPEVMEHCHWVTVLRGGKLVGDCAVASTNPNDLARLIVGGALPGNPPAPTAAPGREVLQVDHLSVRGDRGQLALKQVSLSARAGEIVGIAGVDGSGQRELFKAIAGLMSPEQGDIRISGETTTNQSMADRLKSGLRIIPEDRHEEGVIEEWSLYENASLGLQRMEPLSHAGRIDATASHAWTKTVAARFNTKHSGLGSPMSSLSGGNQQRFVAARALSMSPRLILAFQPARGLDLGGTAAVYAAIRAACDEGASALVVSFDLDELLENCDRVLAMNLGELYEPRQKDRNEIGRLMVGAQ